MSKKTYQYHEQHTPTALLTPRLSSISPVCLDILYQRGYDTSEKMTSFLFPDFHACLENFAFQDMDRAVSVLQEAVEQGTAITVYHDYDVDGCASCAVMLECLRAIGAVTHYYSNDRVIDGYGICENGIDQILAQYPDTKLILTVDNGISGTHPISYAKSKGLSVIVTDHHEPTGALPVDASAVIDPKRLDECYPFHDFCGTAIAFKVMLALYTAMGKNTQAVMHTIDLVALATVADVVPLHGENRVLVQAGLASIRSGTRPAFAVLNHEVKNVTAHHTLSFLYAPMINALSRMGETTDIAVEFFLETDLNRAGETAKHLTQINESRKKSTTEQMKIAMKQIDPHALGSSIILYDPQFTEGMIGLIAGRLKKEYNRPCIVFADAGDHILKASGRSVDEFDIKNALDQLSNRLLGYGGHKKAAGFSIQKETLFDFSEAFTKLSDTALQHFDFAEKRTIDYILDASDLNVDLVEELHILEPYGEGFQRPIFGLRANYNDVQFMGTEKQHVKYLVRDANLSIIEWNGAQQERLRKKPRHKFVGFPQVNEWRANVSVQFVVDD
ncbi:MAG: single-stranded-DNA-specific exonuclease RecJ [Evtepia sp.]